MHIKGREHFHREGEVRLAMGWEKWLTLGGKTKRGGQRGRYRKEAWREGKHKCGEGDGEKGEERKREGLRGKDEMQR